MADEPAEKPEKAEKVEKASAPKPDVVSLVAIGSFHEDGNFQGRLLHGGDAFTADRSRAVELRANGLVRYADDEAEKAATGDDTQAMDDTGRPIITSKSAVQKPAQLRTK